MIFRIPSRSVDLSPKNSAKYRVVARANERPEGLREISPSSSRPFVCSYTFDPIMSNRSLWRIGWWYAIRAAVFRMSRSISEGGDREELLHRQFRGHRESLHVDLAVREVFLPQLHLLQMGQEEEGHEHGHLVPDAARGQLAQRNRLPVELREPVPREGDVLSEVLPVHLAMEVRGELSDGLFAQGIQLELDFRFPAGLAEGVHQLHERDGPASFSANRFRERGHRARQDDLVGVEVPATPAPVGIPAADIRLGLRRHRVEQDLIALHLQDGPREEDELAGGYEVHGAVCRDLVQEELCERHEVHLPWVEAPLERAVERRDHGLPERVPDGHAHALVA